MSGGLRMTPPGMIPHTPVRSEPEGRGFRSADEAGRLGHHDHGRPIFATVADTTRLRTVRSATPTIAGVPRDTRLQGPRPLRRLPKFGQLPAFRQRRPALAPRQCSA